VRTMTGRLPRMLRADAQENRDRVLEAAREVFAERGIDVPVREIARRAGVGPATLYRRFPTKQELVEAALADEVRICGSIVEQGCADPDAWNGLRSVVERLSVLNARNQGFTEAFSAAHPDVDVFGAHRARMVRMLTALAVRARDAGSLRPDFVVDDLVLVLLAGRALATTPVAVREAAARRFAALALEAFRASDDHTRLPRAPRLAARAGR
jgi:AcrR family transcriptional regulator